MPTPGTRPKSRRRLLRALALLGALACAALLAAPHLSAWRHLRAARSDLDRRRADDALDHLRPVLRVWPNSRSAKLLAARACRYAGDFEQAEAYLDACQAPGVDAPDEVLLEWAMFHAAVGDFASSEEFLRERAQKDVVAAPLAFEALASGYLRTYRVLDAQHCLDRWIELEPGRAAPYVLRGNLYRQVNAYQKAVEDYRRAVELDADNEPARLGLATCLQEIGRYDEALKHLEAARARRPDDPDLLVRLARSHEAVGQRKQARQLLDKVLADKPEYVAALRQRGRMAMLDGDLPEAESWLTRAAAASPNDYQAQFALFQCLEQEGKKDEAKVQGAKAQRLKDVLERIGEISQTRMPTDPHNPALHAEMGVLHLRLGNDEAGENWLLNALGEDAGYEPAHAALADFYVRKGDAAKAAEYRAKARGAQAPTPGKSSPPKP